VSPPESSGASFCRALVTLLYARFPLLHVDTHEEDRLLRLVEAAVRDPLLEAKRRTVFTWTLTHGLSDGATAVPNTTDPARALQVVAEHPQPAVFLFLDLHHVLRHPIGPLEDNRIRLVRTLRSLITPLRSGHAPKTLVIVGPGLTLPADLDKDVHLLELEPPSPSELHEVLAEILAANRMRPTPDCDRLVTAARGLTRQEAENAFARALGTRRKIDDQTIALVNDEKRQAVRRTQILEFVDVSPEDPPIGGLEVLTGWLQKRRDSWLGGGADWGVRQPRGILITGVPGCGKSMTAKQTSVQWKLPLLRLDVGRIFAGLVGSSEANMREALRVAEAMAPSILWIDEVEKGFAGAAGSLDSGVGSRVFGTFLTWMQEKKAFVFVIATANDIGRLPPEFMRKGRFDEIFFVDLPTARERARILRIHIGRYLQRPRVQGEFDADDATFHRLAEECDTYSGAEIEQAVDNAVQEAFWEQRPLRYGDVREALRSTRPLAAVRPAQIEGMRVWATEGSIVNATSGGDFTSLLPTGRSEQARRVGRVLG
jgi:hypothetical protein